MSEALQHSELLNVHSEELQEVVGQAPKGIVRWGMTVFVLVLLLIAGVSFFVKYADVLNGQFALSPSNAPKSVISKIDGRLQTLLVKEKDTVERGQILAYVESNASHEEAIRLSTELGSLWGNIQDNRWELILHHHPASYKKLGELQGAYQIFIAAYIQLHAYLKDGVYVQKKKLLQHELQNLGNLKQNLEGQEKLYRKDYEIATQEFKAKEQLYDGKLITLLEYKQEESKYSGKQLLIENIRSSIINNNTTLANKKEDLIQLEQQFANQKSNFLQALNTLINNADEWKRKYLLIAPVAGKVTWSVLLQKNQDIKAGQDLFYITPPSAGYCGEILMAQENLGKLKLGQQVLISLSGFPYQEFGKLKGKVSFISDFPNKDKQYYVGVILENGLQTNMNYRINYKNGLTGTAEVITAKTRLINKFLFTIREIIDRPTKNKAHQNPSIQ